MAAELRKKKSKGWYPCPWRLLVIRKLIESHLAAAAEADAVAKKAAKAAAKAAPKAEKRKG